MPYAWIVDYTRWMRKPQTFDSIEEALRYTAETYRRALWSRSDAYVEIWIEKEALMGVVDPITDEFDVPLMPARGYYSETFLYSAAEAIRERNKPTYIYHLGDYDPWGQNAADKIEEMLRKMAPGAEIHFIKLAVTPEQIEHWHLPTRPTKKVGIGKKWRGDSVELDAIHPDNLRALVRNAIEQHVDGHQLQVIRAAEASERELLQSWRPNGGGAGCRTAGRVGFKRGT
jgi:hypothetical protein